MNKYLQKLMKKHKRIMAGIAREFESGKPLDEINMSFYRTALDKDSKKLCLIVADFKCQKCGNDRNLEIHHLIFKMMGNKRIKEYMEYGRYFTCRHYWANKIILCSKHHLELHPEIDKNAKRLTIPIEFINQLKDKVTSHNLNITQEDNK